MLNSWNRSPNYKRLHLKKKCNIIEVLNMDEAMSMFPGKDKHQILECVENNIYI